MADKKEQGGLVTTKDVATTVASAGAAVTSALVVSPTAAPGVLMIAAALVAIFPPILGVMTEAGVRRMKARADRFFEKVIGEWARDSEKTPEEVAGLLEQAKDDPNVADAIWRAVRGLMETPNDAAAVPLGVLAAEYTRDKRAPDAFFRGVVRLLQELEATELEELRGLLEWLTSTTERSEAELVARHGAVDTALDQFADDVGVDGQPEKRSSTSIVLDPDRLFALLTVNGLATSNPGMRFDGGLPEITMRRSTAVRLLRLLGTG